MSTSLVSTTLFTFNHATAPGGVCRNAEVAAYLSARAKARGVEVDQLVNELLRKDIELVETAR